MPERWDDAVAQAHAERPHIESSALVESRGPGPLRDEVVLAGEVSAVSGTAWCGWGGKFPAVLCS